MHHPATNTHLQMLVNEQIEINLEAKTLFQSGRAVVARIVQAEALAKKIKAKAQIMGWLAMGLLGPELDEYTRILFDIPKAS